MEIDDPAAFKDADDHLQCVEKIKAMTIYLRQQAYLEALKQQQQSKAKRFKDASEKQRKAVPSKKTKLKRTIARLKKENRAREL